MKSDLDKVTEEKLLKGGVLAKLYFDMQHAEKERLQPLMLDLINERLLKEPGVVYCYGQIEEPLEREGLFITSATLTVLAENFFPLVRIAFHYAPAGVEILKPHNEIHFKTSALQSMLMDISQISVDYSKYIFERVLKPEDLDLIKKELENRAEIGKKHFDNKIEKGTE